MTTRKTDVQLHANGDYWQARWYDANGKRRTKSLGSKKKLSRRQANAVCRKMAVDMALNPAVSNVGRAPKLEAYLKGYLASRTDLKPRTRDLHDMTGRYLLEHFGEQKPIDRITRADASAWRAALAKGELMRARGNGNHRLPSEATVCLNIRNAKVIFGHAVRDDLITLNPFDRLQGNAPEPEKDWKYVSIAEFEQLLAACRNDGWRVFLGLQRLAGLRRGEALMIRWKDVDLDGGQLTVVAPKTGKRRVIPIAPRLRELLMTVSPTDSPDDTVVSEADVSRWSMPERLKIVVRHAGLEMWKQPFQVLRRNCETDWAQEYPQYAVSTWMGHDIRVSASHYLQIPKALYDQVSGREADSASVTAGTMRGTGTKVGTKTNKDSRPSP